MYKRFLIIGLLLLAKNSYAEETISKVSNEEIEIKTVTKEVIDIDSLKIQKNIFEQKISRLKERQGRELYDLQIKLDKINSRIQQAKTAGVE